MATARATPAATGRQRRRDNGGGDNGGGDNGGNMDAGVPLADLDDNVAGKACSEDSDCPGGECSTTISTGGALGGLLGGGSTPAPGGYCTGACLSDANCGAGGTCVGAIPENMFGIPAQPGQCQATCESEGDCRDGYICTGGITIPDGGVPNLGDAGAGFPGGGGGFPGGGGATPDTCQPRPETGQLDDGEVGTACESATDCAGEGTQCATTLGGFQGMGGTPVEGGYCTAACLENSECGSGGVCVSGLLGGAGTCYTACEDDDGCTRDGFRCRTVGQSDKGCVPASDPLPDNTAGNACTENADCGGATCATELPAGGGGGGFPGGGGQPQTETAPGGYCTSGCLEDVDCGAGGSCVGGFSFGGFSQEGTCFKSCTTAGEACDREGYVCEDRGTQGGFGQPAMPDLVCVPGDAAGDGTDSTDGTAGDGTSPDAGA